MTTTVIRPATPSDAVGIARVQIDTWRSTYQGIISQEFLAGMRIEQSSKSWEERLEKKSAFVFVAELTTAEIVGFVVGGKEATGRFALDAEIYALYVLSEHQGKRVGKALFEAAVSSLRSSRHDSLLVWSLTQNPWRRFYEKMGGKAELSKMITIGDETLPNTGYVWRF